MRSSIQGQLLLRLAGADRWPGQRRPIDTLNDILIDGLTVINATKGFDLKALHGRHDPRLHPDRRTTTSAGAPYVITADTVTDLCVDDNRFDGWLRGISLSSCGNTWRVLE